MLDHTVLLRRLRALGFTADALRFVRSYLGGRVQAVADSSGPASAFRPSTLACPRDPLLPPGCGMICRSACRLANKLATILLLNSLLPIPVQRASPMSTVENKRIITSYYYRKRVQNQMTRFNYRAIIFGARLEKRLTRTNGSLTLSRSACRAPNGKYGRREQRHSALLIYARIAIFGTRENNLTLLFEIYKRYDDSDSMASAVPSTESSKKKRGRTSPGAQLPKNKKKYPSVNQRLSFQPALETQNHFDGLSEVPDDADQAANTDNQFETSIVLSLVETGMRSTHGGSQTPNPRGSQLYEAVTHCNCLTVSSGEPTYCPADPKRLSDLIDFAIVKGVCKRFLSAASSLDLSSDHALRSLCTWITSSTSKKTSPKKSTGISKGKKPLRTFLARCSCVLQKSWKAPSSCLP
ncbi:unnamed protein product [Trichogramma brassicae]|uniref:Uncharacterized protein n=1 Tax=Trichogramma brassicae TaxID=86971 RepID=A0A6H5HX43_9HYME|nr:unnamed protein product [Trichogramma brassicae]